MLSLLPGPPRTGDGSLFLSWHYVCSRLFQGSARSLAPPGGALLLGTKAEEGWPHVESPHSGVCAPSGRLVQRGRLGKVKQGAGAKGQTARWTARLWGSGGVRQGKCWWGRWPDSDQRSEHPAGEGEVRDWGVASYR